jgi:carbonic anhydrase
LQARDNIAFRHLEQFEKLMDVGCAKTDQLSYSVPIADLLPDSTTSFYRYAGSLTDARCNEDVIWTVFDTPIAISERQVLKFN